MDGRYAVIRAIPETEALDYAGDVLALAHEGRRDLECAYQAHVMDDWSRFLHHVGRLDETFREITGTARRWAEGVQSAPQICPNQLPLQLVA